MTDEVYHRMHVERAKRYRKRKLQTDVNYRNQTIKYVKNGLKNNPTMTALNRRRKIGKQRQAKDYHRAVVQVARQDETTDLPSHVRRQLRKQRIKKRLSDGHLHSTVKRITPQQRYWMRRTRLLALARQRKTTRQQQEKMHRIRQQHAGHTATFQQSRTAASTERAKSTVSPQKFITAGCWLPPVPHKCIRFRRTSASAVINLTAIAEIHLTAWRILKTLHVCISLCLCFSVSVTLAVHKYIQLHAQTL